MASRGSPVRTTRSPSFERRGRGFALIFALLALVLVSLGALAAMRQQRLDGQRERELQLLWVGGQYRAALRSYYAVAVGGAAHEFPKRLEDLLEDPRQVVTVRHLRQLYADPLTDSSDWVYVRQGDRIVGVYSPSERRPLRKANFGSAGNSSFATAKSYRDWVFSAQYDTDVATAPAQTSGNGATADPSAGTPEASNAPPISNGAIQCYNQYMAPQTQCNSASPPVGDNARSCMQNLVTAYAACMAAGGS